MYRWIPILLLSNATIAWGVTIDFEDRVSGELLTDQYETQGVLFSGTGPISGLILAIPEFGVGEFGNSVPNVAHAGQREEPTTAKFIDRCSGSSTLVSDFKVKMGDGNSDLETFSVTFVYTVEGEDEESSTETFTTAVEGILIEASKPIALVEFRLLAESASGVGFDDLSFSFTQVDSDCDTIIDAVDNCIDEVNIDQRDTDQDGIGNLCDADLNNDCAVNFLDLGLMKNAFFTCGDLAADFNGSGCVDFVDLGTMKSLFFSPPGPSGTPNLCDGG